VKKNLFLVAGYGAGGEMKQNCLKSPPHFAFAARKRIKSYRQTNEMAVK
jgi:hypothetical protein